MTANAFPHEAASWQLHAMIDTLRGTVIDAAAHRLVSNRWRVVALFVLVASAHSSALAAGWIWDDDYYVTHNATLRSLNGLWRIWFERGAVPQYYPMTHTSFWLEYRLWGVHPTGYHVVNVLLHAINTLLLWTVLRQLRFPGAMLAAALFGVHPMHVESVAWVTERKNVLSALFYFAAMLAYLRGSGGRRQRSESAEESGAELMYFAASLGRRAANENETTEVTKTQTEQKDAGAGTVLSSSTPEPQTMKAYYWLSMALFICALLSKSVTSSLPAVVLLLIWGFRGKITWRYVAPLIPFFVLGLLAGWNTSLMERDVVGAVGPEWDFTFIERCLIAGRAVWFYVGKVLWPYPLMFMYPRWVVDSGKALQFIPPVAATMVILVLFLNRRRWSRWPLVGVLFFGGSLFPALGFINLFPMRYSFVADHFAYIASIGLLALVAAGIVRLQQKQPTLFRGIVAIAIIALSLSTWTRGLPFADAETLWIDTITKNPTSWMARANLGALLIDKGDLASAEKELLASLALNPRNAEAMVSLGRIEELRGRTDTAIRRYHDAIETRPSYPVPHYNLGVIYARQGDVARAAAAYETVLELNPKHESALNNLGVLLFNAGRPREAIERYEAALRLNPDNAPAHRNLANALSSLGRTTEAEAHLRAAQSIEPESAIDMNNRGIQLAQQGDLLAAKKQFEQALERKPDMHEAHLNLGVVLEKLGKPDEAAKAYQRAVELNPRDPRARQRLERLRELETSAP